MTNLVYGPRQTRNRPYHRIEPFSVLFFSSLGKTPQDLSPTLHEGAYTRIPGPTLESVGPAAFRRAVERQRSSSYECSASGGVAPIRVDLSREASSSLPFHSLPAILDFGHQILSLDHVHDITILAQNSAIRSHGQLHSFRSIQVDPEPEFRLQPSDHRANPYGRHPRVAARPAGHHQGRPA